MVKASERDVNQATRDLDQYAVLQQTEEFSRSSGRCATDAPVENHHAVGGIEPGIACLRVSKIECIERLDEVLVMAKQPASLQPSSHLIVDSTHFAPRL